MFWTAIKSFGIRADNSLKRWSSVIIIKTDLKNIRPISINAKLKRRVIFDKTSLIKIIRWHEA